jgi:predicted transglutaminase-like protease
MEIMNKFILQFQKKQFCPTLEDLESEDLRQLTKKLKGDSEKETLTNILEWQHRNIPYWMERGILEIPLLFLTPLYFILSLIAATFVSVLFYLIILPFLGPVWSVYIGFAVFLIIVVWSLLQSTIIKVISTLLFSFPAFLIIKLSILRSLSNASFIDSGLLLVLFNGVLFGASLFTIIYLVASYLPIFRGETRKSEIQKLIKILSDTFKISLSVERILYYRLAICRDYAKLTASILFKLNPDTKVYFITIPRHVAAAIKVNDAYYVLDQRLPIMTMDRWLTRWNQKKADILVSKILSDSNGIPLSVDFSENEKITRMLKTEPPEIDTEKLTEEITKILGIKRSFNKAKPDFEIPLKNLAIYYSDNDLTRYSLLRAIKNKLESELCGNMSKISEIRIYQNNSNLIVGVSLYIE